LRNFGKSALNSSSVRCNRLGWIWSRNPCSDNRSEGLLRRKGYPGVGGGRVFDRPTRPVLPAPDSYNWLPPSELPSAVLELANIYVAYARDISAGTRLAPIFADAVRMHTIIDLTQRQEVVSTFPITNPPRRRGRFDQAERGRKSRSQAISKGLKVPRSNSNAGLRAPESRPTSVPTTRKLCTTSFMYRGSAVRRWRTLMIVVSLLGLLHGHRNFHSLGNKIGS
jgi:hypothetical protein